MIESILTNDISRRWQDYQSIGIAQGQTRVKHNVKKLNYHVIVSSVQSSFCFSTLLQIHRGYRAMYTYATTNL